MINLNSEAKLATLMEENFLMHHILINDDTIEIIETNVRLPSVPLPPKTIPILYSMNYTGT